MCTIFTEFWPFVATVILLGVVFDGIADIVRANRGTGKDES